MSESIIRINERKIYDFYLQGHEYQLTHNELLQIRDTINEILGYKSSPLDVDTSTGNFLPRNNITHKLDIWRDEFKKSNKIERIRSSSVPLDYEKMFEKGCDPRSGYGSTFVYYKDNLDNWGFQSESNEGLLSPFYKLGKIGDNSSILGELYEKIPSDKPFVKRSLLALGVTRVTEGRRLKACVDILEYDKKIQRDNGLKNNNVATYRKLNKSKTVNTISDNERVNVVTSNPLNN